MRKRGLGAGGNAKRTGALDEEIGERIRSLRLRRGLSQSELGARLGVSFQQIQKYEAGTNRISASRLLDIAMALAVPIADLFGVSLPDQENTGDLHAAGSQADRLNAAFNAINSDVVRRRLLVLIEAMANDQGHA